MYRWARMLSKFGNWPFSSTILIPRQSLPIVCPRVFRVQPLTKTNHANETRVGIVMQKIISSKMGSGLLLIQPNEIIASKLSKKIKNEGINQITMSIEAAATRWYILASWCE